MNLTPKSEARTTIDMAPMVDIVFILVTYFLVNATLVKEPLLDIQPPKSVYATPAAPKRMQVYITKDKTVYLNQNPVSLSALPTLIKDKFTGYKGGVVIKADENTPYKTLVSVIDKVKEAGVEDFHLAAEF